VHGLSHHALLIAGILGIYKFDLEQLRNQQALEVVHNFDDQNLEGLLFADR
jgi:hypothetical protein